MPERADLPVHEFITIYCSKCGYQHHVRVDCGFRFCPDCSQTRASRIRLRLRYILDNYRPPCGQILKMITLSTTNCQDLGLGIKHLIASFRRLRQRDIWRKHVSGGATIVEITGKKGDYHPHLHVLCYADWVDWYKLREAWTSVSGGLGVYITCPSQDKAIGYVTKYVTKCDCPDADHEYISHEIKKYRLFQRFGLWHKFKIPKLKYDYPCPSCHNIYWISEYEIRSARIRCSGLSPPRTAAASLLPAVLARGATTLPLFPALA